MAELDWSILRTNQPVDIAGNFARGYQLSTAIMDKFHERNALAALANSPNDPSALAKLYQVNPQLADHFQKRGSSFRKRSAVPRSASNMRAEIRRARARRRSALATST
jgi:hypothetical protein